MQKVDNMGSIGLHTRSSRYGKVWDGIAFL